MADSENKLVAEAKEAVERLQTFDPGSLEQRDRLGHDMAFSEAPAHASKIIHLFQQIPTDKISILPDNYINDIKGHASNVESLFNEIMEFSVVVESNEPARNRKETLINRLSKQAQSSFASLMQIISYLNIDQYRLSNLVSSFNDRMEEALEEARRSVENAKRESDAITEQLENRLVAADSTLEGIRRVAAESGVTQQAHHFSTQAHEFARQASNWLCATVCMSAAMLAYTLVLVLGFNIEYIRPTNTLEAIQLFGGKAALFSVLAFAVALSARNYLSNKHNETINRHRQNALMTFSALAGAAHTPENRDVILAHASASIFTPQETGFTKSNTASSAPLVGLMERVARSSSNAGAQSSAG